MSIIIFISILLLVVAVLAIRFSNHKPVESNPSRSLPSQHFDGLFAQQRAQEALALERAEAELCEEETRQQLLARATKGEMRVLDEAHSTGDTQLYKEVLQRLYAQAEDNPEGLRSITEHIVGSQRLRSSSEFAEAMNARLGHSPDPRLLADTIYLAALADDVVAFKTTIDDALKLWRDHRIERISAQDLLATVESAYWLVSVEVRTSGTGFLLKQVIADVRRELAAANRRSA